MKLSTRKELLKESELTLKSIKKSLNEQSIYDTVETVYDRVENIKGEMFREMQTLMKNYSTKLNTALSKDLKNMVDQKFTDLEPEFLKNFPVKSASFDVVMGKNGAIDVHLVITHENGKRSRVPIE